MDNLILAISLSVGSFIFIKLFLLFTDLDAKIKMIKDNQKDIDKLLDSFHPGNTEERKLPHEFARMNEEMFECTIANEDLDEGDLVELIIKPNGEKEIKKVKVNKEK